MPKNEFADAARWAYRYADEMLLARELPAADAVVATEPVGGASS